jgi:hypothetical protein
MNPTLSSTLAANLIDMLAKGAISFIEVIVSENFIKLPAGKLPTKNQPYDESLEFNYNFASQKVKITINDSPCFNGYLVQYLESLGPKFQHYISKIGETLDDVPLEDAAAILDYVIKNVVVYETNDWMIQAGLDSESEHFSKLVRTSQKDPLRRMIKDATRTTKGLIELADSESFFAVNLKEYERVLAIPEVRAKGNGIRSKYFA